MQEPKPQNDGVLGQVNVLPPTGSLAESDLLLSDWPTAGPTCWLRSVQTRGHDGAKVEQAKVPLWRSAHHIPEMFVLVAHSGLASRQLPKHIQGPRLIDSRHMRYAPKLKKTEPKSDGQMLKA